MKISQFLATLGIGMALGVGLSWLKYDRQVRALQVHADSVAVASAARDSAQQVRIAVTSDSLTRLSVAKIAAETKRRSAQVAADVSAQALALAKTAADTVPILLAEVRDLRTANTELQTGKTLAEAETAVWQARALAAEKDVHDLNGAIQDLNAKIKALRPPPKLALTILKGASYVGVFWLGTKVAKR